MDSHAQEEIRAYANVIGEEIIAKLFPIAWQAFIDYRLNSLNLSAKDIECVTKLHNRGRMDYCIRVDSDEQARKKGESRKMPSYWPCATIKESIQQCYMYEILDVTITLE